MSQSPLYGRDIVIDETAWTSSKALTGRRLQSVNSYAPILVPIIVFLTREPDDINVV